MAVSEERLQQEIARLNRAGIDDAEFKVAQRNLQRLCKNNSTIVYTEDMTTLYIAMKNLNGAKFRLNVPTLQVWKERFSKETTYKRVKRAGCLSCHRRHGSTSSSWKMRD
jgi:hypothetical protein